MDYTSIIRHIQLVSPRTPCGGMLLANLMIELGVPLTDMWWEGIHIDETAPQPAWSYEHWGPQHHNLTAARPGAQFPVRAGAAMSADGFHNLPFDLVGPGQSRFVLVVRDPRDALWSSFMRATQGQPYHDDRTQQEARFRAYLSWTDEIVGTSTGADMALFLHFWMEYAKSHPLFICRFEDLKLRNANLVQVCKFLGFAPTDDEIHSAREMSQPKRAPATLKMSGGIRAGIPFEWTAHYTQDMLDAIGTSYDPVCDWLGYLTSAEAGALIGRVCPEFG